MEFLNIIITASFVLLFGVVLTIYLTSPLRKIRNSITAARDKVIKDFKNKEHNEIITIKRYHLFDDNKIQRNWEKYFKTVSSGDGNHRYTDISDYFNHEKIIAGRINTALSSIIPVIFFFVSIAFTVMFAFLTKQESKSVNDTIILFICGIIFLSIFMIVLHKISLYRTREVLNEFNFTISEIFDTPCGTGEQLSDIRIILGRYHSDQIKLYSKLNKEISMTVVQKLEPFLDAMEKMVKDYLGAISVDQQKAMEHLADYFMKNTSELYDGQIEKITDATFKMTQIQEKTSGSLENISEFFNKSTVAIDKVINNSNEMTGSYEKYLGQMKEMSFGIDSNIKLMAQMLEYIDENARNKDFTIEKLTSFQQDLIDNSRNSADTMKEFFDDFKETYTSHLMTMKSVSDSLAGSGVMLESSYNNFNSTLGDISGFFENLNNRIEDVRNNSNEMSLIYKENLEQLQSVNSLVEENIKSSSNLTEYINNSLKSNNFTVEKLTEFQKELIDVSEKSSNAMNEFFADFKDHYSSYIIAMKAASADMQKSGEIVKESYSGFATNLDREVSEVFGKFEENLTEISIRFAKSIKDLQEAIDELPEIIKGIKS